MGDSQLPAILESLKNLTNKITELPSFSAVAHQVPPPIATGYQKEMRPAQKTMEAFQEDSFGLRGGESSAKKVASAFLGTERKGLPELSKKLYTSPLKSLEMYRRKKIATSPSYRGYMQQRGLQNGK